MNVQVFVAWTLLAFVVLISWSFLSVEIAEKIWPHKASSNPFYAISVLFAPAVLWALYTVITQS